MLKAGEQYNHQDGDNVRVVVYDPKAKSFAIVREAKDNDNAWKLPGGNFLTPRETPTDGAQREVNEELGIKNIRLLGGVVLDNLKVPGTHRYIFLAVGDKDQVELSDDTDDPERIVEVGWVKIDEIPDCDHRKHIYDAARHAYGMLAAVSLEAMMADTFLSIE